MERHRAFSMILQREFCSSARLFALAALLHCAMATAGEAAPPVPQTPAPRPNIVVILADDLGYGDLGCFGQKMLQTPKLDAMATEGIRFTQFYAGGASDTPSRCVLLTGRHAGRLALRGDSAKPMSIPSGQPTIASILKEAGYATACIGKWGLGSPGTLTNPNDLGFDYFYGYVDGAHSNNPYPEFLVRNGKVEKLRNVAKPEWKNAQDPAQPQGGRGVAETKADYAPALLVEDALRYLREPKKSPFFLLLSLNTPHANIEAGEQGMEVDDLGEFAAKDWPAPEKSFAAMLRNIDRDTGRVLGVLKELALEKNTLVIFTSDNGPHKNGGRKEDFFDSNGKHRGGKYDLAEGGIRVPMISWWPGKIAPGGENDRQWYIGDLLATAAELAGANVPGLLGKTPEFDSDSFVLALYGQPSEDKWKRKSPLYWELHEGQTSQAVRFGKWKALRSPMFTGPVTLYDMSNDPGEKHDYSVRRPQLTEHAINLMNKLHTPDPNWPVRQVEKAEAKPASE